MSQRTEMARRIPSQARATTTVDTLFEATARILESDNSAALTTNHIARLAGFSIGTLYGYFPNKHALLLAMARREAQRQKARVLHALAEAGPDQSAAALVRLVIRAAVRPFEQRDRLRMAMMKLMMNDRDVVAAASAAHEEVMDALLREIAMRSNGTMREIGADTRFMLHAAISGAIKTVATERMDIFETQAFEDDIVRLMTACTLRS
jgi:AcrR family transcriptional regulator